MRVIEIRQSQHHGQNDLLALHDLLAQNPSQKQHGQNDLPAHLVKNVIPRLLLALNAPFTHHVRYLNQSLSQPVI